MVEPVEGWRCGISRKTFRSARTTPGQVFDTPSMRSVSPLSSYLPRSISPQFL
jgi:hypothetical protein